MVILRRGFRLDQELIAKELGIKVTKDALKALKFNYKIAKDSDIDAGYDIQHLRLNKLNSVFKKHKMPIEATFIKISKIKNIDKFILENMKNGNDIDMLFLWKAFGYNVKYAHHVLISSYNKTNKVVEVCDPALADAKSCWKAKLSRFISGMSKKWDGKERGFFVFESKK
jgi:hypothetical protein